MTLPFENGRDGRRRWQCFVCGLETKEGYPEFREHVLAAHEEGREFVLCPKCDAPVRDLKVHYKVKHAGWPLPPGVQHRATVWSDLSSNRRKQRPSVKFRQGTFESKKNGRELHYRSGYECEVYEILEVLPDVVSYGVERLQIPYLLDGRVRNYVPDLTILFADGRRAVWEIKPGSQTSLPINEAKWTSADKYCRDRGWEFQVITETGIGKLRLRAGRAGG